MPTANEPDGVKTFQIELAHINVDHQDVIGVQGLVNINYKVHFNKDGTTLYQGEYKAADLTKHRGLHYLSPYKRRCPPELLHIPNDKNNVPVKANLEKVSKDTGGSF